MTAQFKGLIATVGGAPEPLLKTLAFNRPQYVLFVVSEGSLKIVEDDIVPKLDYSPNCNYLIISDHNDMGKVYQELRDERIENWLNEYALAAEDVCVDITGGTKAMTAGLALAGVERFRAFSYVGGTERTKDNLGQVVTGSEYLVSIPSPWDTYNVRDLELANKMLAVCNADEAASVLVAASEKCSPDLQGKLRQFTNLARMLRGADRFKFDQLPSYVGGQGFRELCDQYPGLASLGEHWQKVAEELRDADKTPGRATLLELLANAERRARQGRYEDALARIRRAVEVYAQQLVKQAFGGELGRVAKESIPSPRRDAFDAQFGRYFRDGWYHLGLARMYRCLEFSDVPELQAKAAVPGKLQDLLDRGQQSLLGHGVRPVEPHIYQRFMEAALEQLEIESGELPRWPELELKLDLG